MSTIYTVSGMTCNHCVARVHTALSNVAGVSHVEVSLTPPRVVVDGENVDLAALNTALADTSFTLSEAPVVSASTNKRR